MLASPSLTDLVQLMMTSAPRSASLSAIEAPSPVADPVTSALRPAKSFTVSPHALSPENIMPAAYTYTGKKGQPRKGLALMTMTASPVRAR